MMKVLCLLVVIGLPSISIAQKASPAVAPDLTIVAYELGPFMRKDISRSSDSPELERQGGSSSLTEINPPRYQSQVKPRVKLRNTGARTIKGVDCEFLLLEGAVPTTWFTTTWYTRLTMHVKKAIRPGATVQISKLIMAEDLRTFSRLQKKQLLQVRANIIRIEYADGSVWDRGPLREPVW